MRAATVRVGLVSPRSTCESLAALTPLRSARSRSDRPADSRSAFTRAPTTGGDKAKAWSGGVSRVTASIVIQTYVITDVRFGWYFAVAQGKPTLQGGMGTYGFRQLRGIDCALNQTCERLAHGANAVRPCIRSGCTLDPPLCVGHDIPGDALGLVRHARRRAETHSRGRAQQRDGRRREQRERVCARVRRQRVGVGKQPGRAGGIERARNRSKP